MAGRRAAASTEACLLEWVRIYLSHVRPTETRHERREDHQVPAGGRARRWRSASVGIQTARRVERRAKRDRQVVLQMRTGAFATDGQATQAWHEVRRLREAGRVVTRGPHPVERSRLHQSGSACHGPETALGTRPIAFPPP